ELFHELQIAINLLQHRIDDQRLAARPAGEEIGVGAGCLIKELTEHHGATFSATEHTDVGFTCVQAANAFLSTPSGLALSLESFATKSARPGLMRRQLKRATLFDHLVCMSQEAEHPGGPAVELRRLHGRRVGGLRGFVSVSDCRRRELIPASPRKRELTGCAQLE